MLAILLILGVAYGWIYWSGSRADAETASVKSDYANELAVLTGEKNRTIVDFQNRITLARDLMKQKDAAYESLPGVEKAIVPGVFLESYKFDASAKKITVDGLADDFYVFSKQILSFKKSDYFSEVTTGKSSLNEAGKVTFSLNLKIK